MADLNKYFYDTEAEANAFKDAVAAINSSYFVERIKFDADLKKFAVFLINSNEDSDYLAEGDLEQYAKKLAESVSEGNTIEVARDKLKDSEFLTENQIEAIYQTYAKT